MKRTLIFVLTVALIFGLTACGGDAVDLSSVSADDITASVKEGVVFVDDMLNVKTEVVKDFYNLPEGVTDLVVYMSASGATAEELAIFKCDNPQTVESVVKACEKRIENLKEKFEDYIAEELDKINNAAIKKRDCFVMLVCADSTDVAEKKFEEYK